MTVAHHIMTLPQALILSVLQGLTELFPFSSLGLTVILPKALGWHINQSGSTFLPFVVMLHVGTASALLIYFWKDWYRIIKGFFESFRKRRTLQENEDARMAWLLIFGTIPAGLLGLLLSHKLKALFAAPTAAAIFLFINGLIMLLGERFRKAAERGDANKKGILQMRPKEAIVVGFAQSLALLPGISRSGVTMVAGLMQDLSHVAAARYSFLLATPIILAAALLEVHHLHGLHGMLGISLIGGVVSGVVAYLSARFLMQYFKFGTLKPFAYISMVLGILSLVFVR